MKRIVCLLLVIVMALMFSSCSTAEDDLPSGRASSIRIQKGAEWQELGKGEFEYINETTIKFERENPRGTYIISSENLIYIEVEYLNTKN